uniref:Actin-related protein 2/3 complex subunit 3 n=1 Tax=Kwoniella dejecticola CBS 10117 TaxID=1296121 RepID=A0A1A6ABP4_9TREE|nr:arp2/3 complex 21 kDa subunit [Kwoniella dejecticola CBS 10117]OBR87479.1 arp2/3 complex 21 kDa subunit [Kwoniella dejecticola CBS 10117]
MFNDDTSARQVGNMALLPINTKVRGPAPLAAVKFAAYPRSAADAHAFVHPVECIRFRANCLFRNFEIKGPADRLMIYLILFISECLTKLAPTPGKPSPGYQEALKLLQTQAVDTFALPGDAGFPLNSLYHAPANRMDADALRSYLTQTRTELAIRLVDRLYTHEQVLGPDGQPTGQLGARSNKPSKWWMSFQKRR